MLFLTIAGKENKMAKVRRDTKGKVLHRGETYKKNKGLYCFSYTDPLGTRRCVYAKTLEKLREKETRIEYDRLDGLDYYAIARSDVNYVFDRYIRYKTELRSSTMANYLYTYNRYVRNGFGKKKIADVRYSDVLMFYSTLMDRGLALNTISGVHGLLSPTFQMAVRDRVIKTNPTEGVMAEIGKKTNNVPDIRHALTLEEERAFLRALDEPKNLRWKPLFTVMFGTGVRVGEVGALRWDDVDFPANRIDVVHSLSYGPIADKSFKCEYQLFAPKTEAGRRSIPLLDTVRTVLEDEKRRQQESGEKCRAELSGLSGFIFYNRFGGLLNQNAINKVIKRIVNDHNATEEVKAKREKREPVMIPQFSCHVTRHTFCTRLCENETNIKFIQTVMGHKDVTTTLEIYAEVTERKKQEVISQLNHQDVL